MSYTQSLKELINSCTTEVKPLELAYLNRELLLHTGILGLENNNNPYLAAYQLFEKTTILSGDLRERFGTVLCNTLVRWFNANQPHPAVLDGIKKWDIDTEARSRYIEQCQILLMSGIVTAAIFELKGIYGEFDTDQHLERLSIIGAVVRRGFWNSETPDKQQILELNRSVNTFATKIAGDTEYQHILNSTFAVFIQSGENSRGFHLLLEEASRRSVPLTILIAPEF